MASSKTEKERKEEMKKEKEYFDSLRNILLIGPSGSGKSTILNAIYNNSVDWDKLKSPAMTSSRADGVTEEIKTFHVGPLALTDTIGFDDRRYEPEKVAIELRRMLRNSDMKYEKVILCMKLGRVSEPARVYLRLLKAIFDNPASNMILYISGGEDGTTVDDFIKNNISARDEDLKELLNSLIKQGEQNKKKKIPMENIIIGTMQCHKDQKEDKERFLSARKETFAMIKEVIDVDIGYIRIKNPIKLWKSIGEWLKQFFSKGGYNYFNNKRKALLKQQNMISILTEKSIPIKNHYGKCPICGKGGDDDDEKWVSTPECHHRFHLKCFAKNALKKCYVCKEIINKTYMIELP